MRTFDVTQVAELRDVFPELTDVQFETAILFSLGLTKKEIALQRNVSYPKAGRDSTLFKNRTATDF